MRRFLQPSLLFIPAGLALGLLASVRLVETDPAFFGWILGPGLGLMGGAFLAAITSGSSLVSGPAPKRTGVGSAPWLNAPSARDAEEPDEDAGRPAAGQ